MKEIGRTHVPSNLYARQCHSCETLPFVADEVPVKAGMEGEPCNQGEKLPLELKPPPPPTTTLHPRARAANSEPGESPAAGGRKNRQVGTPWCPGSHGAVVEEGVKAESSRAHGT